VDLVPGEFGLWKLTSNDNRAAGGVNFPGVQESFGLRKQEQAAKHFDHVVVGVFIIVEQDDMIERDKTLPFLDLGFGCSSWPGHQPNQRSRICVVPVVSHSVTIQRGGVTDSTGLNCCEEACRVPSSRKTIGKPKLPISSLLTLPK